MPTVAFVHDHMVGPGGSERVLLSMHRAFPDAVIHTAFFRPELTHPPFRDLPVRPFAINRIPWLRARHRYALPIMAPLFSRQVIDADVVICGSSGWSAGVRTKGRKIVYVHSPARWLHDAEAYLAGRSALERWGLRLIEPALRRWDRRSMVQADRHLVPSRAMAELLDAVYGIEAEVLPPPVALDASGPARPPAAAPEPGFVLYPARLVPNKNVDVAMDTFRSRPHDRLVVAGDGPEMARLRATAPPNVSLLGFVDDAGMRWLYGACRAVVSVSHESFGLTTIEGAAFGRPSIALRHGGLLDTVVDGRTGVHFDRIDADQLAEAVERCDGLHLDPEHLRQHASRWSEAAFVDRLRELVAEVAGPRGLSDDGTSSG